MKMILKIFIGIFFLYLISVLFLYFFQEKFIFQNKKLNPEYSFSFKQDFEEINLKTSDNQTINTLLFKVNNPKGVLLFFHGNKGSLKRWGNIVNEYTKYNHDVFVMDYRSYGKSTGGFNEELMYKDAEMCYDYLKEIYGEDIITIYGRSLGATFAIKTASIQNPKLLILEAPFYNLYDVVDYHYPLLTSEHLLKYKFRSDKYIQKVNCKTVIFHGDIDNTIPISSSKKLLTKNKDVEYIEIKTGTHHNLGEFEVYKNKIHQLLK